VTVGDRSCPSSPGAPRIQRGPRVRSRPVADASGAPVLRDQGPIGRPGTARPMQASSGTAGYLTATYGPPWPTPPSINAIGSRSSSPSGQLTPSGRGVMLIGRPHFRVWLPPTTSRAGVGLACRLWSRQCGMPTAIAGGGWVRRRCSKAVVHTGKGRSLQGATTTP
jgi:hypothetical protein